MTARFLLPSKRMPYVERVQDRPKLWMRIHGDVHHSLIFAFDPVNFIRNPSKVVADLCDYSFYGSAGGWAKVQFDGR